MLLAALLLAAISDGDAVVIAAAITGVVTVVGGIIQLVHQSRTRTAEQREANRKQSLDHGRVLASLTEVKRDLKEIKSDVKAVDSRLDTHIEWHMNKEMSS